MNSSFQHIRDHYHVPAKLGGRVRYEGKPGTITGADTHLIIRPDLPEDRPYKSTRWRCHPTWHMEYLDPKTGAVIWPAPTHETDPITERQDMR